MTTTNKIEVKMISRVIAKAEVQKMLKALRSAGCFTVTKLDAGYEVTHKKAGVVFKAMQGNNGYLVRMAEDLFN